MNLYVIAGHGAGDPGACANGATEAERVRALARRIKELGGAAVTLHDVNDNAYASGALNRIGIGGDTGVIELHMDSAGAGARGAHVIIKRGFQPDGIDRALADGLCAILPGRAQRIVGRSNLANPNRAASRGINYRLVEFGFITSPTDLGIFNGRMDDIARAVLSAFGIGSTAAPQAAPAPAPQSAPGALEVDGLWGASTTRALQRLLGTPEDGAVSSQPSVWRARNPGLTTGWEWTPSPVGSRLVAEMQRRMGAGADGMFGPATANALIARFMGESGATVLDGRIDAGSPTVRAMQRALNEGRF